MDMRKILKHQWEYSYTRRMSFQKVELYFYGLLNLGRKFFDTDMHFSLYRFKKGDCSVYFEKKEIDALVKHLEKLFQRSEYIQKVLKRIPKETEDIYKKHEKFLGTIPADFSQFSNRGLIDWLEKMYTADAKISPYYWFYFTTIEDALVSATKLMLKKENVSPEDIETILSQITLPYKITPIDKEQVSLLKIALQEKNKQEKALVKHWKKFSYMPMYDIFYTPHSKTYFQTQLKKIEETLDSKTMQGKIDDIARKYSFQKNFIRKTLKRFEDFFDIHVFLTLLSKYAYCKEMKVFYRDRTNSIFQKLFAEVARRLNLSLEEVLFLNRDELKRSLLKKKSVIFKEALQKRITNSIIFCERNDFVPITEQEKVDQIEKTFIVQKADAAMRGIVAYRGKTQGKVSLILSNNDFSKFQNGDILVASATRPDFVPLMKRSCAIITDEGGLLSHAAILSRELKVPCIVGTKIATKVLKDGDLVEVDAIQGKVTLVKK